MLDFVKRAYRKGIEVLLWINLILSTIVGGLAGYYLGQLISNSSEGGGFAFLGVIIGIMWGLLTDIVLGGFIVTIISIEKNTNETNNLLKRQMGLPSDSVTPNGVTQNNTSTTDDWVCKKCSHTNRKSALFCISCGEKK
jgi:hypothetical protein